MNIDLLRDPAWQFVGVVLAFITIWQTWSYARGSKLKSNPHKNIKPNVPSAPSEPEISGSQHSIDLAADVSADIITAGNVNDLENRHSTHRISITGGRVKAGKIISGNVKEK